MSIERLSGGLTPADGSDPRTFPAIFNEFADEFEDKNIPAFGTATPSDGDALVYNDAEGVYEPGEGGAGALEDLTDTDISSPSSDEFLRYDGTDWVNTVADATTSTAGVVKGTTSDGANTALGVGAFESNTTGSDNTAVGRLALQSNTTGSQNTAVGRLALLNNTEGSDNTGIGSTALAENTTGSDNTAVGRLALQSNTTGSQNTASGNGALRNNTTGDYNTAVGRNAGDITTTGSNNATLGYLADPSSDTASNQVTLGNSNITSLRCNQTSISSLSDVRDKTNIETTTLGLDVINQVRPVEFTWARRDGTMGDTPDLGFIAQELAEVEDDLGETDRLRLTLRDNPEKLEASPNRLLPVLVKAVQELSAQNDELRARLDAVEGN